jgi:chromosome segregation ATPase
VKEWGKYMTNDFMVELMAALSVAKSKKQINQDIKNIEKSLNTLRLTANLFKGESKKQVNAAIKELESKARVIRIKADFDSKQAQKAVNDALKNVTVNDIKINEQGIRLKARKIFTDIRTEISKTPIPINFEIRKETLQNQLTSYLAKNSKINESSVLLNEADTLRGLFGSIDSKDSLRDATEKFKLFKSEVTATGFASKSTSDKVGDMVGKITRIGTLFGVASVGINKYKDSVSTLKDMSTILTEIAKTSNIAGQELKALGDNSFGIASKYGQNATNYLEGVREMARSGYDSMAKELGELSVLAQSAGDMTAEMANNYLLATDAAYKYGGSVEKLTAALDGANYISNRNSATLTDIADATRVSASYAAEAGVKIDELTAAEATMVAATKRSGSEMGRAFRSILLNLQQVSGEFDGEIIDEEQLKKVEKRVHSLGVELEVMGGNGAELRNPMEVLKELAQVYNSLPENSAARQGLISDLGGKYHANALTALLSRWDMYEKMLSEFSRGSGSSLNEAMKTADSWEGRLNSLQNTWNSFVNSITNQDHIKGGVSFLDNTIQAFQRLIDTIGALPVLLTAVNASMTALNKDYGLTQFFNPETSKVDIQGNLMGIDFTAIKAQKKHFEEAGSAIDKWNGYLRVGRNNINDFGVDVVKNNAQLKEYLSTCSKEAPASLKGYQAYLKGAGVSTDALRWKTVALNAVISLGIGVGIQLAIAGITKFIQRQEEVKQAASDAADRIETLSDALKANQKTVSDSAKRFAELKQGIDSLSGKNVSLSDGEYEEFLSISNDLAKIFPTLSRNYDENGNAIVNLSGNVDTIVGSLQDLIEAQRDLTNSQIADELPTVFKGAATKSDAYKAELNSLEQQRDALVKSLGNIQSNDFTDNFINGISERWLTVSSDNLEVLLQMKNDYEKLLKEANIDFETLTPNYKINEYGQEIPVDFTFNITSSDGDIEIAKKTINKGVQELASQYEKDITELNTDIANTTNKNKSNWSSLGGSIAAWLNSDSSYKVMSDSMQSSVQQIINNLDWSSLDFRSWDNAKEYVQENIISLFEGVDGSNIAKQFEKAFNLKTQFQNGEVTLDEYLKGVTDFKSLIDGFDDNTKKSIDFIFNVSSSDGSSVDTMLQNVEDKLQDSAIEKVGELSLGDLEIASNIKVPDGVLLSWEELLDLINKHKESLKSAPKFATLFSELPIDKIEEYISLLNSGNVTEKNISSFSELNDLMSQTGTNAEDAVKAIKDYADGYTISTDLTSNIQNAYDLLKSVGKQYKETGKIGLSSLESIAKQYPQLRSAVNEYTQGLISADDMIAQLQTTYDNDANAYRVSMANRLSTSTEFFSFIYNNNKSLFDELSSAYGLDVQNWKTMAQAKAAIDQKLIQSLSSAWSKYYNIVFDSISGLASLDGMDLSRAGSHGVAVSEEQQKAWSEATKQANKYNQLMNRMNEAASIQIVPPDFGGKGSVDSKSGSSKKDKSETEKEINWYERQLQLLNDKRAELMEKASDSTIDYLGITNEEFARASELFNENTGSVTDGANELAEIAKRAGISLADLYTLIANGNPGESRENYLAQALELDKEILSQTEQTVEGYKKVWEDAASKISSQNKSKIELGHSDIETFKGDDSENVQDAIDAYDKWIAMQKQYAESQKKNTSAAMAQYDNSIAAINKENEQLEKSNSILEARMNYLKSIGEIPSASLYGKLINNTGTEISNTQKEISDLKDKLKAARTKYGKESEEYANLDGDIKEAKKSLYGLKQLQEEYNNKLKQMPIDHLSTMISMYGDITAKIENWGAVHTATGKKLDSEYYQTLISNGTTVIGQYEKQIREIKSLMSEYQKGSTVWQELYDQLQNIDSATSSMLTNLQKWNEELLKMPLDSINTYSDSLQKVITGLNGVKSELDSATSAITTAISDRIDLLQEEQKVAAEAHETEIDALEEKEKALKRVNEEAEKKLAVERAEYDLARLKGQKTVATVRDGIVDYENDNDAIRQAQEALANSKADLEEYNLQRQIEDARTALDDLNDSYQDQIDALEKISQKYSEIISATEKMSNANLATSLFGEGWADKVLSGNDAEIYSTLSSLYQTNAKQLDEFQKQADSTSNIQSLIENYIDSYKAGTITYEQAMTKINGLLSQMNESMTAMDNLQNIYDYLGTVNGVGADADSILKGIKDGLSTTADELVKSLEEYNKNAGTISEHTSSWEQLTDNVSSMLDVLKQVRDNLRNALDDYDSDDDDGPYDKSRGKGWGTGDVNNGPGVYGDGIKKGAIGTSDNDRVNMLKHLSTKDLKDGEVPIIAHEGEVVLNPNQQGQLLDNVDTSPSSDFEAMLKKHGLRKLEPDQLPVLLDRGEEVFNNEKLNNLLKNLAAANSFKPNINVPDYSRILNQMTVRESTPKQEINFNGGINIQECNDANKLAQGILNGGLRSAINQEKSKR